MEIQSTPTEIINHAEDSTQRLTKIAQESAQAIADSQPIKKKRGPYKKKDGEPSKREAAQSGAPNSGAVQGAQNQIVDTVPIISMVLQSVSQIPAARLKCPPLALTEEEAKLNAQAFDQLFKAYTPDVAVMDPKTAAWIAVASVAGSTLLGKLMVYSEYVSKRDIEPVRQQDQEVVEAVNTQNASFPFQRQ